MGHAGEGRLKVFIWLALFFAGVFVVSQCISTYLRHAGMVSILKIYANDDLLQPNYPIRARLTKEIQITDPSFTDGQLNIEYSERRDAVHITFPYRRPMDLKVTNVSVPIAADFYVSRAQDKPVVDNIVHSFEAGYNGTTTANQVRRELNAINNTQK